MSEAFYYMKAIFPQPLNKKEKEDITSFFTEMCDAADHWHKHREFSDEEVFWNDFQTRFPVVSQYISSIKSLTRPYNGNSFTGVLMHRTDEDITDRIFLEGSEFYLSSEQSSFFSPDHIGNFLKSHFGAVIFRWGDDIEIDYHGILDAEITNEILTDLLKQKEILPTLIGINPILDAKIAETLNK